MSIDDKKRDAFELLENKKLFILMDKEVELLYDFFIKRAGYVSHEFDPFIHVLNKRLSRHIEEIKK